ncbi:MAG: peptidoglycan-associated lipoprotein Pal [Deltaproteobacteria bacterium]|nr:peptidoglycan-associated lipoprotein Pal [Deltaproteobacteria bacterium]
MKFFLPILIIFLLLPSCKPKVIQPGIYREIPKLGEKEIAEREAKDEREDRANRILGEAKIETENILTNEMERERKVIESPFKDIFFDFDSYLIKAEYYPLLDSISEWLKLKSNRNVIIEGHCDERGTHEYNLILGQKRGDAVRDYLVRKGVDPTRLKVISYGKERPIDPRHTEEAWAKNRRAHFRFE